MNAVRSVLGRTAGAFAALLVAAALAACGSSSTTTTATTSTPAQTNTSPQTTTAPTTTTTPSEGDVSGDLDTLPQSEPATGTLPAPPSSQNAGSEREYLTAVFNDAQRFWQQEFTRAGIRYLPARLTLFTNAVHSGCGEQAEVGPFYCPANRGVYLDLSFFELLARHAGIGPFGPAYIIGHEFGHHVQHLTGIDRRVAVLDHHDPAGANNRSVRVELQADCLAGVWAHSTHTRGQLTEADLQDALKTAAVVGDDFQQHAAGHVVDSAMWTHGSSAQRQHWLIAGFRSGHPNSCDTFSSHSV